MHGIIVAAESESNPKERRGVVTVVTRKDSITMSNRIAFLKPAITTCALLALAGYALTGISLAADQFRSYHYNGTNVRFDPQVTIWWGDGERAYTATKKLPDEKSADAAKTAAGKAHIRGQIAARLKAAMGRHLPAKLNGTKPARVEVIVKRVAIPSGGLRVIGGGSYTIEATINLIDGRTGKVLVSNPNFGAVAATGTGIVGVLVEGAVAPNSGLDRVIDNLAIAYGNWLSYWATK
jgi:hypothetical protein